MLAASQPRSLFCIWRSFGVVLQFPCAVVYVPLFLTHGWNIAPKEALPHVPGAVADQVDEGPALPGRLEKGLKKWGYARTNKAVCIVCKKKIDKDRLYLTYRVRASMSLADCRRSHIECIDGLPLDTRQTDVIVFRNFVQDAMFDGMHDLYDQLIAASATFDV